MPRMKKARKKRGPQLSSGPKVEITVPVVRAHQSPLNEKQWLVTLECGHERWMTSDGEPKKAHCSLCEALAKPKPGDKPGSKRPDSWGWAGGEGGGKRRGPKAPDSGGPGK